MMKNKKWDKKMGQQKRQKRQTPSPRADGYVSVMIHKKKSFKLHRLIAVAFDLPRLPGQTTVKGSVSGSPP